MPPPAKRKCLPPEEPVEDTLRFSMSLDAQRCASRLEGGVCSPTKMIGGYPWLIFVKKSRGVNAFLGAHVRCDKAHEASVWFCETAVRMTVVNQEDEIKNKNQNFTRRFDITTHACSGYPKMIEWAKIMDDSQGFVKDNTLIIEAHIKIKSKDGKRFREKQEHDFFSPSKKSDVILIVEGKEFHVGKQILSIQSSYFDSLFYTEFKEKGKKKIPLEEVSAEEFETLLRIMYRLGDSFEDRKLEGILKLAEMWDIKNVLNEVETHLILTDKTKLSMKLSLADNFALHTLYDTCMNKLTTCQMIHDLQRSAEFAELTEKTKDALFMRFSTLCSCKKDVVTIDLDP